MGGGVCRAGQKSEKEVWKFDQTKEEEKPILCNKNPNTLILYQTLSFRQLCLVLFVQI